QWKKYCAGNEFWLALAQNPWIEDFCKKFPGFVVYGELVPTQGQAFSYGQNPREFKVYAFDIYDQNTRKFLTLEELNNLDWTMIYCSDGNPLEVEEDIWDNWVPKVAMVPYEPDKIREYSVGPSLVPHAKNKREGIVIKTLDERRDPRFGRIIL